jgi:hypothetical protein
MVSSNNESKAAVVTKAQQLSAGVAKHLGSTTQVTLLGGSYTAADLTTKLQQVVSLQSDVDAAKATVKAKLSAQATNMSTLRPLTGALVSYVKASFGSQPDVLADFGIHPKVRVAPTVEAKAAAAAKRAATRVARGTKGSVQKKAVKGDVTGITITPTTAPQPSAPVVTSSPTAGAASSVPTASPTVGAPSPVPTAVSAPHAGT